MTNPENSLEQRIMKQLEPFKREHVETDSERLDSSQDLLNRLKIQQLNEVALREAESIKKKIFADKVKKKLLSLSEILTDNQAEPDLSVRVPVKEQKPTLLSLLGVGKGYREVSSRKEVNAWILESKDNTVWRNGPYNDELTGSHRIISTEGLALSEEGQFLKWSKIPGRDSAEFKGFVPDEEIAPPNIQTSDNMDNSPELLSWENKIVNWGVEILKNQYS